KGMNYWNKFLKKGGYVAVTEASWFTEERPEEIFDFWNEAYPEIDTIPNKITHMQKAGYVVVATFILPEFCWIDNFFVPEITAQKAFLDKYKGNKSAEEFIKYEKHHALLYDKYKDYYGYVFYIGKKI
ncbi:MAG: SAM-dependent methyltransferase, partial [Spirochaetes bacterium]|nr:SAM-dependent methyltransferase [Spirochaetota bacterium]